MKRLLLAPLLVTLLLTSCSRNKYNSQIEAKEACDKWEANGIEITHDERNLYSGGISTYDSYNRICTHEKSTRQYLGYVLTEAEKGRHYTKYEYIELKTKK